MEDERKLHEETVEKLQQEIFSLQAKNVEIAEKTQQAANLRVSALENKIESLENARAELNAQFVLEKSKWTEEKSAVWAEATEKQMCKILLLTDKVEHVKQDKQRLEQELALVQMTVANLQRENSSLRSELAEPPRKIAQLQEELNNERLLTQRLRSEKADELRTVDQLRCELVSQKSELVHAQKQLADLQAKVDLSAAQHQRDLEAANCKLQEKAREISAIR
ncbi:hypothetical protein LSTR_LSTR003046 [Laodelphax striatellus]|uniref:Uncharacterized protein n=1 Tax=Laodelphax striatellus TaxID=195883 RepID=A0A482XUF7_LAOST|nr:hypothetical protein LSTR_LSTR003046 [Laodelphax striatellus]